VPLDPPVPSGLVLAPFPAVRYDESSAGPLDQLLSPPYDVIDDEERAALEAQSPCNVVRLILPRESDGGGSPYAAAAQLLTEWTDAGVLRPDTDAAIYVYEMRAGDHVTRGLLGAVALARPEAQIVLPHENTMAGPVADRLALMAATEANLEPIYLVYDGGGAASAAVADAAQQPPLAQARTPDGVEHRLWALTEPAVLGAIEADLAPRRAVIADGHHRYATYLQYQADRHAAGAGPGPWDFGLTLLVDAAAFGPQVHAIHRVLPGLPAAVAADQAAQAMTVRAVDGGAALAALADAGKSGPAFVLSDGRGAAWLLTEPDAARLEAAVPAASTAWRELDVTVAHYLLVRELWGLTDDERVVGFRHDVAAAEAAAAESGGTALLLNPTPVEAVVAVAAAGDRMPRKSTLFTPKPRTGLVLRLLG
jgi:uncharacterized protein (DUF1015 family)